MLKSIHPVFVAVFFIPIMALGFFFYRILISLFRPVLANFVFRVMGNILLLFLALLMVYDDIFRTSYIAVLIF